MVFSRDAGRHPQSEDEYAKFAGNLLLLNHQILTWITSKLIMADVARKTLGDWLEKVDTGREQ